MTVNHDRLVKQAERSKTDTNNMLLMQLPFKVILILCQLTIDENHSYSKLENDLEKKPFHDNIIKCINTIYKNKKKYPNFISG